MLDITGINVEEFEGGWFSFKVDHFVALDIWGRLANDAYRCSQDFRERVTPKFKRIKEWGDLILTHAKYEERDHAPRAGLVESSGSLELWWEGTWTPGREVRVEIFEEDEKPVGYVRFNTGTGKKSEFLSRLFKQSFESYAPFPIIEKTEIVIYPPKAGVYRGPAIED